MKNRLPRFKDENQEREFWRTHDSTNSIDWTKAKRAVLPKRKPSLKMISIRLPASVVEDLKLLANQKDIPCQSLLKVYLAERIEREKKSLLGKENG